MGYRDERLWKILEEKAAQEDKELRTERQLAPEYLSAVKTVCDYGVQRAKAIRDTFPLYTLHDEVHICNVLNLMAELLGDEIERLNRDEAAMLILSACCHDIGMSYSKEEKEELFKDGPRIERYLNANHSEYIKAYQHGGENPVLTDDMKQNYLRSIHHERVQELLNKKEWPWILDGRVDRDDLIRVCRSHGEGSASLSDLEKSHRIDLRFCAILLRLADILDFDSSRAPDALYEYSEMTGQRSSSGLFSKEEWDKHMSSHGFDFKSVKNRSYPYPLEYNAVCRDMQVEQKVNGYLNWVDHELEDCRRELRRFNGKWQDFILPDKIKRGIKAAGYVSGQYRLTLDQDQVLTLFTGENLYNDPAVFVRELIQNAIDAVRTRKQIDRNLPADWQGQINITSWRDKEGRHWFRIEDNGIGMTESIIRNYFLKIGRSYYNSDEFTQMKMSCSDCGFIGFFFQSISQKLVGIQILRIVRGIERQGISQNFRSQICSQGFCVDICNIDGDSSRVSVYFFILYAIVEFFEKEVHGFRRILADITGILLRIYKAFIRDERLNRVGIKLLDQRKLILNCLGGAAHLLLIPGEEKADQKKLQDQNNGNSNGE